LGKYLDLLGATTPAATAGIRSGGLGLLWRFHWGSLGLLQGLLDAFS